ncbi:hypothetical protein PENTCL1PPCAC_5036, partial [Pristionchus entomophagus]
LRSLGSCGRQRQRLIDGDVWCLKGNCSGSDGLGRNCGHIGAGHATNGNVVLDTPVCRMHLGDVSDVVERELFSNGGEDLSSNYDLAAMQRGLSSVFRLQKTFECAALEGGPGAGDIEEGRDAA